MILDRHWKLIRESVEDAIRREKDMARAARRQGRRGESREHKARRRELLAVKMRLDCLPSWLEVWAALDTVADVVEGWNLDEGRCLECDAEVDEEGVCIEETCRLRDGLLVRTPGSAA